MSGIGTALMVRGTGTREPPCVSWRLSRLARETSGFASQPRGGFALSVLYPIERGSMEPGWSVDNRCGHLFESQAIKRPVNPKGSNLEPFGPLFIKKSF